MAYSSGNPFGFVLTPWVKRLIIANAVAFVIVAAFRGLLPYLVFTPALVLTQPWTLATYMFVHGDFFHLLFNMLALFFFGPPLEDRWGSREFLKFYLIAGAGGALLSFLFVDYSIAGASAGVYGVMAAFAMYWPENPIYIWGIFPVKAKWLVGFLVGLSLFMSISGGGSNVAHLAHLGGALAAFGYLKSPMAPSAWGPISTSKRQRNWSKVLTGMGRAGPQPDETPAPVHTPKRETHAELDEVDRILDKISHGGMASLTDEEKQRLEELSRKYRAN